MRAVNLIPAEQRGGAARGAGRSGGGAYAVLGLLAGLVVLALLYGSAHRQVASNRAKVAALEVQVQQTQANATKLAPYTSFIAMREQRAQAVAQLVDSRFDWAHAFHELGRVLPKYVSIASLTGTVGSLTPAASAASGAAGAGTVTSATPPGSVPSFTLSGCATTQSAVARTLERLRLMDGVSSVTLQSSSKSGAASGASGACPGTAPTFTVAVSFEPLPVPSTTSVSAIAPAPAAGGSPTTAAPSTGGSR
jgi:Tfp pilus assembly protein PilN